jgi:hypothetical protein
MKISKFERMLWPHNSRPVLGSRGRIAICIH